MLPCVAASWMSFSYRLGETALAQLSGTRAVTRIGRRNWPFALVHALPVVLAAGGCSFGPRVLEHTHGRYYESFREVHEQEFLRNLVHLRYNEYPFSLNVSSVAAQYELAGSAEARPFFVAPNPSNSNVIFKTFTTILPDLLVSGANRPTITLLPGDEADAIRQFLTPISAETLAFLSETTWPVSTILRLWVERLNGVPNAVTSSGPQRGVISDFARFLPSGFSLDEVPGLAAGRQAVGAVREAATPAATWMWSLLPLLGLGLLAVFLFRSCNATPLTTSTTTARLSTESTTRSTVSDVTRLGDDFTRNFKSMDEALTSIKDAASAEAVLPKLREFRDKLDSMKALVGKLPEAGKAQFTQMLKTDFGKLQDQLINLMWIPGVASKIKTVVGDITDKMASIGGFANSEAPQLSGDLSSVFSSRSRFPSPRPC
jgi:hypothetical protein